MNKTQRNSALTLAKTLAAGAGRILHRGFRRSYRVTYKGRIDPVTEYDLKAEKFITKHLATRFPEHALLTEEGTAVGQQSDYCWVIDPLDGTVNFAHGFGVYCVSIALQYQKESMLGVVYDPERDEMFTASKGGGAFLNGKRIKVSEEARLDRALLCTGFAYDIATAKRNNLGLFAKMAKKAQGVRRPGSAALDLCWLAAGRIDGYWELKLKPWDTAAGTLVATEAGGRLSRVDGRPHSIFAVDLLASNGKIHRAMRETLSGRR